MYVKALTHMMSISFLSLGEIHWERQHIKSQGFPNGSVGKEATWNAGDKGDAGLIPGSGRSPGGGNGNPLQYSCQRNPMDRV